jgi:hypothetical protein
MASVASDLAGMVVGSHGSTASPTNSGQKGTPGSGPKTTGTVRAQTPGQTLPRGPAPPSPPRAISRGQNQKPQQPRPPKYSANNPPPGTPMSAPPPHPGVIPPYPDARSPQPTLMPNGVPIMPPPPGFLNAGMMGPRVPPTFTPGMTGLLGQMR